MVNIAAFDEPISIEPSSAAMSVLDLPLDHPVDSDGLAVPELWHGNPSKWQKLAIKVRHKFSCDYLIKLANKPAPKQRRKGHGATRFTTDYAVKWGRKQGWLLIERESYDYRTKRHRDTQLGTDAVFDDRVSGMVAVQAAGRGELAVHYQRFLDRGGPEKAKRRGIRVIYAEFVRGNPEPIRLETWA